MGNKLFWLSMIWLFTILAYIILGAVMPAFQSVTAEASTNLQATSNMSNYPGALQVIDSSPVYVWFIPGAVAVIATVVMLRDEISQRIRLK